MAEIFISYRWGDKDARDSLEATMKNPNNSFYDVPLEDRERFTTNEEIQSYLDTKLNDADVILALIGDRGHSGRWMNHELKVARNHLQLPIVVVRIEDTNGRAPIVINDLPIIGWNMEEIQKSIDNILGR